MACAKCDGYYSCGCDIIAMRKEIIQMKERIELLQYKIKDKVEIFNKINAGYKQL